MYLRLSPYREILQGVITSLQLNEGIIKITGKSGSGKTALCSQLFHELEANGQPAVFFLKPPASAVALQNDILDNLALDPSGNFTRTLTAYLLAKTTEHKPLVLIFDDAQQLDPQTFSAIRMLCNIQDQSRGMVRVILCGNEDLDEKLASPALRAVTQFLSQSFTLPYLTAEQVSDFCQGFWMLMGEEMKPMGERVLQTLFLETRGHPGILQARLKQGTTGAEPSERQGREGDEPPAPVTRPYRYAGQRKGWVPALLIVTGLVVLGGASAYLYLTPSLVDQTDFPTSPPVADQQVPASAPQPVAATEVDAAADAADVAAGPVVQPDATEPAVTEDVATADPPPSPAVESLAAPAVAEPESTEVPLAAEPVLPPVEDFIAAWTASWQAQDLDAYLASYDAGFVPPQDLSREDWEAQRRRVIGNAVDIRVSAEAPEEISEAPDGMRIVRFWLDYSAASYADRTLKELLLVPDNGTWRIRAETNLRTERK